METDYRTAKVAATRNGPTQRVRKHQEKRCARTPVRCAGSVEDENVKRGTLLAYYLNLARIQYFRNQLEKKFHKLPFAIFQN